MHCTHTKESMHSFLYRIRKPNRNVYILSNYSSHKRLKIALRMQFTCAPLLVCNHLVVFVRLVAFHLDGWWWRFRVVCAHAAYFTHTKFTCEPNWKIIYDRNRLPFETVNYYLCKCPTIYVRFQRNLSFKICILCTVKERNMFAVFISFRTCKWSPWRLVFERPCRLNGSNAHETIATLVKRQLEINVHIQIFYRVVDRNCLRKFLA